MMSNRSSAEWFAGMLLAMLFVLVFTMLVFGIGELPWK